MLRTLPLLVLTLAACQNPQRDELLNWLDDYDYERTGVRTLLCSCPTFLGYDTDDECEADQPALTSSNKECIADVFEGNENLGIDYFSCVTPQLREYSFCLMDHAGFCEMGWSTPCSDAYDMAVADSCPALSSSKEAEVFDCMGG